MAIQLTVTEIKAKLLSLLKDVEAGQEVEITRHGRMIARLVPAFGPVGLKGSLSGVAATAAPDDALFSTNAEWTLE